MSTLSMAKPRSKLINRAENLRSCLSSGGALYQGIKKKRATQPIRRSARLADIRKGSRESSPLPSPTNGAPSGKPVEYRTVALQASTQKRKRQQEPEDKIESTPARKKPRAHQVHSKERALEAANREELNPINYWRKEGSWPKEYFKQDDQTKENFQTSFEKNRWFERYQALDMDPRLQRKASASSLRRVQSESVFPSDVTPSDQRPRDEKSAPYKHPGYEIELASKGSFMDKDKDGPRKESKELCRKLLEGDQNVPEISRFSNTIFESTCRRIQSHNEAKVNDKIARLIVPSAEDLTDFGSEHLECLVESINAGWNSSLPVTATRPQPDYAVGFGRSTFTKDQLDKLELLTGNVIRGAKSWYMATWFMYLPFLTCEVKCGAQGLDIADRQNAHSMTLAVRGVVEMFRRVEREKEIDREILAFSVSHDHSSVRIYGHYPVINEREIRYYRYSIHKFDFTALEGKDKWTAYKFVKNLYDTWLPSHFKRLCSVIDELQSEPDFGVPPLSEGTGLSQVFQSHHLSRSNTDRVSLLQEDDSQASRPMSQDITPNTSFSQPGSFKKPRKRRAGES